MLARHLQTFFPPDPLHPLGVDPPTVRPEQGRDPAMAIAAIRTLTCDDRFPERLFVVANALAITLGGSRLVQNPTGATLGNTKDFPHMNDTPAPLLRAQYFPLTASSRMGLSSVRSETALLSLEFFFSSYFSRRA